MFDVTIAGCLFTWYPSVAKAYREVDDSLAAPHPLRQALKAAGVNLPFAAHAFNLGPFVECWWHRDARNYILGVCPVVMLGAFNHRTSGQLILVEPKVVIELRRGDLFFLMSSILTHGTAPLTGPHREVCSSFV